MCQNAQWHLLPILMNFSSPLKHPFDIHRILMLLQLYLFYPNIFQVVQSTYIIYFTLNMLKNFWIYGLR
jgi:hypothetical protein